MSDKNIEAKHEMLELAMKVAEDVINGGGTEFEKVTHAYLKGMADGSRLVAQTTQFIINARKK